MEEKTYSASEVRQIMDNYRSNIRLIIEMRKNVVGDLKAVKYTDTRKAQLPSKSSFVESEAINSALLNNTYSKVERDTMYLQAKNEEIDMTLQERMILSYHLSEVPVVEIARLHNCTTRTIYRKLDILSKRMATNSKEDSKYKSVADRKANYYGVDILGIRLLRKLSVRELSKVVGFDISIYDKNLSTRVPVSVINKCMEEYDITMNHIYQFREIAKGKNQNFEDNRNVSKKLKELIYERDDYKCTKCSKTDNLHMHHKKKHSEGGLTDINNLVLLCAPCHAEEHKEEKVYNLIKSLSER